MLTAAERHFPGALKRTEPDSEGYWLHLTGGKITELVHMPARAQKVLSKPINAEISKEVRAVITCTSDSSMGAAERRERAEETCNSASGYAFKAHPWQSSQTLSLASHAMHLMLCSRYCLGGKYEYITESFVCLPFACHYVSPVENMFPDVTFSNRGWWWICMCNEP